MKGLDSVSSQCARGKSSIARKPEDHPKNFNLPDFKFYPTSKLTDAIFPHNFYGVMLNFLCLFLLFNAVKTDTQ